MILSLQRSLVSRTCSLKRIIRFLEVSLRFCMRAFSLSSPHFPLHRALALRIYLIPWPCWTRVKIKQAQLVEKTKHAFAFFYYLQFTRSRQERREAIIRMQAIASERRKAKVKAITRNSRNPKPANHFNFNFNIVGPCWEMKKDSKLVDYYEKTISSLGILQLQSMHASELAVQKYFCSKPHDVPKKEKSLASRRNITDSLVIFKYCSSGHSSVEELCQPTIGLTCHDMLWVFELSLFRGMISACAYSWNAEFSDCQLVYSLHPSKDLYNKRLCEERPCSFYSAATKLGENR